METNKFDPKRFCVTEETSRQIRAAQAKRLLAMTPEERRAHYEAEEADAMRYALSEEEWGEA